MVLKKKHKMVTSWSQFGHKLATKRPKDGHKTVRKINFAGGGMAP